MPAAEHADTCLSAFTGVPIACFAAAASVQVRIVLDRDEDMAITGQRHAFMGCYKVRWLTGLPGSWCMGVA